MNVINVKLWTSVATMLALGLLCLEQPALAQSNCKEAKGNTDEVFFLGGNSTSGTLSNGGWLNGTTLVVFTGANPFALNGAVFVNSGTTTIQAPTAVTVNGTLLGTSNFALQSGSLTVTAVQASHDGRRHPAGLRADTVGYVVRGRRAKALRPGDNLWKSRAGQAPDQLLSAGF